jgi:hypothetical protein
MTTYYIDDIIGKKSKVDISSSSSSWDNLVFDALQTDINKLEINAHEQCAEIRELWLEKEIVKSKLNTAIKALKIIQKNLKTDVHVNVILRYIDDLIERIEL